jgi:hypothetical protein
MLKINLSEWCVVSDYSRKYALECARLAADCMQIAGDAPRHDLQVHFLRMAEIWTDLAVQGPGADVQLDKVA